MAGETSSSIKEISKIKFKESAFEWWGPSPAEARRIAVSKPKELRDKRTTLKEAVKQFVREGANIALGGFVNVRSPIAIAQEIIRQGAKDLTLSFHSQSMAAELLSAMTVIDPHHLSVKRIALAGVGYEVAGSAPMFGYLTTNGMVEVDDYSNYGMAARFKAAAMGVPFLPIRDHGGSDMELVNKGKMIECPFTGENIYLVPACHPDVGIIHVQAADKYGNCRIMGPLMSCAEIALASAHTIVTAEEIISEESIRKYPNLTEIPFPAVDAVIHQPNGGYPGAVYGFYWFDQEHLLMFRDLCQEFRLSGNKKRLEEYYDRYIFGCKTFEDFLGKIDGAQIRKAKELDGGQPIIL